MAYMKLTNSPSTASTQSTSTEPKPTLKTEVPPKTSMHTTTIEALSTAGAGASAATGGDFAPPSTGLSPEELAQLEPFLDEHNLAASLGAVPATAVAGAGAMATASAAPSQQELQALWDGLHAPGTAVPVFPNGGTEADILACMQQAVQVGRIIYRSRDGRGIIVQTPKDFQDANFTGTSLRRDDQGDLQIYVDGALVTDAAAQHEAVEAMKQACGLSAPPAGAAASAAASPQQTAQAQTRMKTVFDQLKAHNPRLNFPVYQRGSTPNFEINNAGGVFHPSAQGHRIQLQTAAAFQARTRQGIELTWSNGRYQISENGERVDDPQKFARLLAHLEYACGLSASPADHPSVVTQAGSYPQQQWRTTLLPALNQVTISYGHANSNAPGQWQLQPSNRGTEAAPPDYSHPTPNTVSMGPVTLHLHPGAISKAGSAYLRSPQHFLSSAMVDAACYRFMASLGVWPEAWLCFKSRTDAAGNPSDLHTLLVQDRSRPTRELNDKQAAQLQAMFAHVLQAAHIQNGVASFNAHGTQGGEAIKRPNYLHRNLSKLSNMPIVEISRHLADAVQFARHDLQQQMNAMHMPLDPAIQEKALKDLFDFHDACQARLKHYR